VLRRPAAIAFALAVGAASGACREGTVQVSYRPRPGDRQTYRITVRAESVTTLADEPPRRSVETDEFITSHDVLDVRADGSTVEVELTPAGLTPRRLVVRLDRAAQLVAVERVEGLPAQVLGRLGLSELFPAAAGAPPNRPLAPGDRWDFDEPVALGAGSRARLTGSGQLRSLGRAGGRDVATIDSSYRLPVRRVTDEIDARITLDGTQHTEASTVHRLADGSVEHAEATTRATYTLSVQPPGGTPGPAIPGTLTVTLRSTTTRLG
jgi:hypothetical protein